MSMRETQQLCVVRVGPHLLGIPVMEVSELRRHTEMTPVPRARSVVKGLINLRGQIVTAFDMRRRLALAERDRSEGSMSVVMRSRSGGVCLLVDRIEDVIEVDDSTFERPPETLSAAVREVVRGVHKLDGRLLLVIDVNRVLSGDERAVPETVGSGIGVASSDGSQIGD